MDRLWTLGLVAAPPTRFLDATFVAQVSWLENVPFSAYFADPFLFEWESEIALYCERYDYDLRRGSIHVAPIREGKVGAFSTAYAPRHHVSFPNVWAFDGRAYATFEEHACREVVLRTSTGLGRPFEPVARLLVGVDAIDPVVFFHDGRHWMFVTDEHNRLRIFHAARIDGPYSPHALNPIVDAGPFARAAGRPFTFEGRLYRPVQIGRPHYGAAVDVREIVRLSAHDFEERSVRRIDPLSGRHGAGLHTLNGTHAWTVVDGLRTSRVPPIARAIHGSVRRAFGASEARGRFAPLR